MPPTKNRVKAEGLYRGMVFWLQRRCDFRRSFIDARKGKGLEKFCIFSILFLTYFLFSFLQNLSAVGALVGLSNARLGSIKTR